MSNENNFSKEFFLAGGGEMGRLMRAYNWARTPLGSAKQWPQSLKSVINIMLHSRFPMFLMWGPDLICMYNDAFRPSLGKEGKHPIILGQKAENAWQEVWHIIKPSLEQVFAGNSTWNEDRLIPIYRNGQIEDAYWTFGNTPIYDEENKVAGVLINCVETTDKFLSLKKLEASDNRFRSLISEAPIASATFMGPELKIGMANPEILKLWEKDERVIGKALIDAMPELQHQPYIELLKEVYRTGKSYTGKESLAYIEQGGATVPIYLNFIFKALLDESSKPFGVLAMGYDVTELVEAKNEIANAEERTRLAVDAAQLGTFDRNMRTGDIVYSKRAFEIAGLEQMTAHPDDIVAAIHPDDVYLREEANEKALKTGNSDYEVRIIRHDGSIRTVNVKGKMLYDDGGKPVRYIGIITDITGKKATEAALRSSEERFRLLTQQMPQLVWTADAQGNLNYFSPSVSDYSGVNNKQIEAGRWLKIVHREDREENVAKWMHAVRTGKDFLFEHRYLRHNGEYRWHLSRASAQRDEHGNIQMWVGTSTDIHEQKMFAQQLEEKVLARTQDLQQLNDDLQKINKELASFAYISSHDMQEPLRKIQTFSEHLMTAEKDNLSEQGKEYLVRMNSAANRMRMLIDDLLAYSRTTSTEQKRINTDLNIILQDALADMDQAINKRKAVVKADALPVASVIPFQFRQLFVNILSNSLKFNVPGKPLLINIKNEQVNGKDAGVQGLEKDAMFYKISFADNGIGFEPEYSTHIFEVFQRLHGRNEYEGTGIGLAICKKIVENHNGLINATSRPDEGAVFNIYLPV